MVKSLYSAAAAALFLSGAHATKVSPTPREVTFDNLLGYDESAVRVASADDIIPEITYLSPEEFDVAKIVEAAAPFEPEGSSVAAGPVEKRFINGADDRYLYSDLNYPFNVIGKLTWSSGVFCSAALVGPRHVLTAKHCLVEGATGTFSPGYDNGERVGSGTVTNAFASGHEWGTPCGWKGDWAVLILDNRLGDQLGYLGVKLPDGSQVNDPKFHHVGYPGDRDNGQRPYRTNGNPILGDRPFDCDGTGPIYTDTDCMGGQSGGPFWEIAADGQYIWGTLAVTFDGGNGLAWAGWGSGNEMLDAVIRFRNEFP